MVGSITISDFTELATAKGELLEALEHLLGVSEEPFSLFHGQSEYEIR
jgi:hypothetical protein